MGGITAGPDGALWFTEGDADKIGRITTMGVVTEYAVPTLGSDPYDISSGPDGALWFTEHYGYKIGRITTSGVLTEFSMPTMDAWPYGITAGPDGAMWFTEIADTVSKVARITTAGLITEYQTPSLYGGPFAITTGPDSAIWFTEENSGNIGRITTAGVATEYAVPSAPISLPGGITVGPGNELWFTESGGFIGEAVFATASLAATPSTGSYGTKLMFTETTSLPTKASRSWPSPGYSPVWRPHSQVIPKERAIESVSVENSQSQREDRAVAVGSTPIGRAIQHSAAAYCQTRWISPVAARERVQKDLPPRPARSIGRLERKGSPRRRGTTTSCRAIEGTSFADGQWSRLRVTTGHA